MDATKQNQQSKEEKAIPAAPIQEIIEPGKLRVIKRNGSVVNFDATKIEVAITKAFLAMHTSAAAASSSVQQKVKNLSKSVLETFSKRMPSGGTIHIEEIQDQVELALMRTEELKVARAYVLYRAERSKLREEDSYVHNIENEVQPSERTELIAREACKGLSGTDANRIIEEARKNLYEGAPEEEIKEALILSSRSLVEVNLIIRTLQQEFYSIV